MQRHDSDDEANLRAENDRLAAVILARGGAIKRMDGLDPAIENSFLKQILACDDADEGEAEPLRSLFPDLDTFPTPEDMDEINLAFYLDQIRRTLQQHGLELALQPDTPPAVVYRYLVEDFIPNNDLPVGAGADFTVRIDGCSGYCAEPCFQRKYCAFGQDEE